MLAVRASRAGFQPYLVVGLDFNLAKKFSPAPS
jgi:hypothetical protein